MVGEGLVEGVEMTDGRSLEDKAMLGIDLFRRQNRCPHLIDPLGI